MSLKKTFKHTGVLMMVGVFALGLLGAAYTLWYEDLVLRADIETGTFDVDWSCEGEDPGAEGPDVNGDGVVDECDTSAHAVASTDLGRTYKVPPEGKGPECSLLRSDLNPPDVDFPTANDKGTNNLLELTLRGLYPYSGCEFWIDIHNAGTVPAHFAVLNARVGGADLSGWLSVQPGEGESAPECQAFADAIVQSWRGQQRDIPVLLGERPVQLHADDEYICHFVLTVVEEDANSEVLPEGASASLLIRIRSHQWNEDIVAP